MGELVLQREYLYLEVVGLSLPVFYLERLSVYLVVLLEEELFDLFHLLEVSAERVQLGLLLIDRHVIYSGYITS